jgi:hypothetical protein
MRRQRWLAAVLLLGVVLAAVVLAGRAAFDAEPAGAGLSGFGFAIDCDVTQSGAQTDCTFPSGTTTVPVDVIFSNTSGAPVSIAAFNFDVVASPFFTAGAGADANMNANPDFNESGPGAGGSWTCVPPTPAADKDPAATSVDSFLSCYDATFTGPALQNGELMSLARITYGASDGVTTLRIGNGAEGVQVGDNTGVEVASCNPIITVGAFCAETRVQVGGIVDTPTSTPTITPTPTPTFTSTPCVYFETCLTYTPGPGQGPVTEVRALNLYMCFPAAIFFEILRPAAAASNCLNLQDQEGSPSMQAFVACLRGSDIDGDGDRDCVVGPGGRIGRIFPTDFDAIDLDADQVQQGQQTFILAFVDGDFPVRFSSPGVTFLDAGGNVTGDAYGCSDGRVDPDCDGDPLTQGDGVVVARIAVTETTPRGDHLISVSQDGSEQEFMLHVVGPPKSIELALVNGDDEVEGGDVDCDTALSGSASGLANLAANGPGSLTRTAVMATVRDDDGVALTAAAFDTTPWFAPDPDRGDAEVSPLGGAARSQGLTMDLGAEGIGFPQLVCGGTETGTMTFVADKLTPQLNPLANTEATAQMPIRVIASSLPPTPTLTPVPTATDTPTPTQTATPTVTPTASNTPTVTNTPVGHPYQRGELFVGADNGRVLIYSPDGDLVHQISHPSSQWGTSVGLAFDAEGNLYQARWTAGSVAKYDHGGNVVAEDFITGLEFPQSLAFDAAGHLYVGEGGGAGDILKYAADGTLLARYDVAVELSGADAIDLAADQCTMFYTSAGASLKRFDVCTNQQLPDFATDLGYCFEFRLLPDGGALLPCYTSVVRLDASGAVVSTYYDEAYGVISVALSADGGSFWTATQGFPSEVLHFNLASGARLTPLELPESPMELLSLAVFGEPRAALTSGTPAPTATATMTPTATRTPTATATMTPTATRTPGSGGGGFGAVCADVSRDGSVNSIDLMLVYRYMAAADLAGDINGDGVTDVRDAQVVASQLGRRCAYAPAPTVTPAPTATATSTPVPATQYRCPDVTGDGAVNSIDLGMVYRNFGSADARYDVNGDGVVDVRDAQLVAAQLGRRCG